MHLQEEARLEETHFRRHLASLDEALAAEVEAACKITPLLENLPLQHTLHEAFKEWANPAYNPWQHSRRLPRLRKTMEEHLAKEHPCWSEISFTAQGHLFPGLAFHTWALREEALEAEDIETALSHLEEDFPCLLQDLEAHVVRLQAAGETALTLHCTDLTECESDWYFHQYLTWEAPSTTWRAWEQRMGKHEREEGTLETCLRAALGHLLL